jgi:hypothetical protein
MQYLIAGCSLWKFLAKKKKVAGDYISVDLLNVGDK